MEEKNSKNTKRIFVYGIIMLVCVAAVVLIGITTGPNNFGDENKENHQLIQEKQNNIRILEEQVALLQKEVDVLTAENEEIKKQLDEQPIDTGVSKEINLQQMLADLRDIYEMFKSGDVEKARDEFEKIEPVGFDDATHAYYEILGDILEGEN